ncbi:hypothetical protein D3C74_320440 [compost metagenome]
MVSTSTQIYKTKIHPFDIVLFDRLQHFFNRHELIPPQVPNIRPLTVSNVLVFNFFAVVIINPKPNIVNAYVRYFLRQCKIF